MQSTALVPAPASALVPAQGTSGTSNLYQLDFGVENVGRIFKTNKKFVTWRFSSAGQTHEVVLTWSKRTGKQLIVMDGSEIHEARHKGASIVTYQWTTADGMMLHVLASRPSVKQIPNLQKYELMINGQPFTSLNFPDGTMPRPEDVTSLVTILYPNGYDPDEFKNDPLVPLPSTVDDYYYDNIQKIRNETTARRPVRHDGTAR